MILFPAIDLKDGECVRLRLGDMEQVTVFNADPADQARIFEAQGFEHLHLVDLNGAFTGRPVNTTAVEAVLGAINIPVQLGGGIRDMGSIEGWLEKGVGRVILGTAAVREPALVNTACREFPGQIAVGIDARDGFVAVEGWAETTELAVIELAKQFEEAGVAAIIYTDISRDGVLAGLDFAGTLQLARAISIPVIASGGVASMADINELAKPDYRILEGVISGRAIYDGRIDVARALDLLRGNG